MMKHIVLQLLLYLSIGLSASNPLKIGVITDTHFLSPQLMDDGYALQDYILSTGKNVKDVPAVLDQVLNDYLQSDIEILLVTGDMTKDGEKQSHIEFTNKLKPLLQKGVKIYAIPGNHDINMPNSIKFAGNKKLPVPNISPEDFTDIYADFGYNNTLRRDSASLSYVTELSDNTWLLAIDAARYKEYTTHSLSSGKITPQTEQWIVDILDEAKQKNIQVIGMMHWGLTEHIMHQSTFFTDYLVQDWKRLAALFADKGLKAIFTGHFHSNDITAFTSESGNTIYDIETGTLVSYPYAYRFVEYTPEKMTINTKHVVSVPDNPNLAEEDKKRMQILSEKQSVSRLKNSGYTLSDSVAEQMAKILGKVFVLHTYGDEQIDDDLRQMIEQLANEMDAPLDMADFAIDFAPADNNVEIVF